MTTLSLRQELRQEHCNRVVRDTDKASSVPRRRSFRVGVRGRLGDNQRPLVLSSESANPKAVLRSGSGTYSRTDASTGSARTGRRIRATLKGMEKQYELQTTTVGDLVAEGLEQEASLMPPSHHESAEILRQQAAIYRANDTKVIHIWREVQAK